MSASAFPWEHRNTVQTSTERLSRDQLWGAAQGASGGRTLRLGGQTGTTAHPRLGHSGSAFISSASKSVIASMKIQLFRGLPKGNMVAPIPAVVGRASERKKSLAFSIFPLTRKTECGKMLAPNGRSPWPVCRNRSSRPLLAAGRHLGESSGPCIGVLSFGTETCIFRI